MTQEATADALKLTLTPEQWEENLVFRLEYLIIKRKEMHQIRRENIETQWQYLATKWKTVAEAIPFVDYALYATFMEIRATGNKALINTIRSELQGLRDYLAA